MPAESCWTDERVALLTEMWAAGHSATRIGCAMGMSRGAIMGKIARLELPAPEQKLPIIADHSYRKMVSKPTCPRVRREKARVHERAYYERRKFSLETKRDVREAFLARGTSPYSAAYRKHLPPAPEMSKSEMRNMLAQAMQNTAAL